MLKLIVLFVRRWRLLLPLKGVRRFGPFKWVSEFFWFEFWIVRVKTVGNFQSLFIVTLHLLLLFVRWLVGWLVSKMILVLDVMKRYREGDYSEMKAYINYGIRNGMKMEQEKDINSFVIRFLVGNHKKLRVWGHQKIVKRKEKKEFNDLLLLLVIPILLFCVIFLRLVYLY